MKYIILLGDGMAGRPLKKLGNKTCLQYARTPNMDKLASEGLAGKVRTVPKGFEPGSDVANLSILGYDPKKYYSGRAPVEAAYRGINLGPKDVAFRCNLVTLSDSINSSSSVMKDYSAGHISTKEATLLIQDINKKLGSKDIKFYPGMSYRHLMIWKNGKDKINCTPPHDITGKNVSGHLPKGDGSKVIKDLIGDSTDILMSHPVNLARIKKGLSPANSIWFWGQGKQIPLPAFKSKFGLKGAMISAVDLTKGLGKLAGFDILNVRGATGYLDTNYEGKARAALKVLKSVDFVYLHVEAPDEAGHNGDMNAKIQAIEDFDSRVVGNIIKGMKRFKDYSILLLPDHPTPISIRTHSDEPVPFVIYRSDNDVSSGARVKAFSEKICGLKNILNIDKGYTLMDHFIGGGDWH
ncbi:MAG: cofactor-independent phosphoglycerate mutase [Nitrospirae bacterium]|nr:cofactor-independent phosphoglycerate mutase [Nitrospirota bacterium]